jgi:hypothetical protein
MKLRDLLEASKSDGKSFKKGVSELKFKELLKEKATNSHEQAKKFPIFIGASWGSDFLLLHPEVKRDKAESWLDHLIAKAKSWAAFPDREFSIKATCSFKHAKEQAEKIRDGEVYVLLPYDHTKIGVAPHSEFDESFGKTANSMRLDDLSDKSLREWAERIISALIAMKINIKGDFADSHEGFFKLLNKIDTAIGANKIKLQADLKKTEEIDDEAKHALNDLLTHYHGSVEGYLTRKLDPDSNDFVLTTSTSFSPKHSSEVWISGTCLAIKREKYIELYERGDIK